MPHVKVMRSSNADFWACLAAAARIKSGDSLGSDPTRSRAKISVARQPRRGAGLLTLMMVLTTLGPATAFAQAQSTGQPQESLAKLAEEFTDLLTTLPQLFFRDDYTPANYGTNARVNRALVRAIIPRVPRFSLFPFVQLIRPTFQLVTVPTGKGGKTLTEFGDMELFDLAVLPWPEEKIGFKIGVGPTFVFPTATAKAAGQGAWQAGPACGAVYTGHPGLLAGFLLQNPISFEYTSPQRKPVSTMQFQPIVIVHVWRGWYVRSVDSTWMYNWRRDSPTTLPLAFGVGDVVVRPGLPPLNLYVSGEWMAYRQFAPTAPQTTVTFGLTIAFPQLRKFW